MWNSPLNSPGFLTLMDSKYLNISFRIIAGSYMQLEDELSGETKHGVIPVNVDVEEPFNSSYFRRCK